MVSRRWAGPVTMVENPRFTPGSPEHQLYKEKQKKYYYDTADAQRAKSKERMAKKRGRNQQWMVNFYAGKSCSVCGVSDPRVLALDHMDHTDKFANVSDLVSRAHPLQRIKDEVLKCRVLCHNCHMIRTFEHMGGTYHTKMEPCSEEEFNKRYGGL